MYDTITVTGYVFSQFFFKYKYFAYEVMVMKKNLILCVTVLLFSFLLLGKAYGVERLSDDERAQFSLSEDFKNIDGVLRDEILDKANPSKVFKCVPEVSSALF